MPSSLLSLLLHTTISLLTLLLPSLLHLPSLLLSSLHTYIHPDHLPSSPSSIPIRRPSSDPTPKKQPKSTKPQTAFDESKAQLFRLSLSHPHLLTRLFFHNYNLSCLLTLLTLSNLSLHLYTSFSLLPFILSIFTLLYILYSLVNASTNTSSRNVSLRRFSLLSGLVGFLASIYFVSNLVCFKIDRGKPAVALLAGILTWLVFCPAARAARGFWIGTDQLSWDLEVVSCGPVNRFLLYVAAIASFVVPLLSVDVVADAEVLKGLKEYRIGALFGCGVMQMVVVRANVQMYLNEAVLCWYQRLHLSRVPDLEYGRAKVFLHNHYVCLVAMEFVGPAAMVMVLVGVSQLRGELFGGFSDYVKECALFLAWWIVFAWGVVMMSSLALFRTAVLIVS